MNFLQSKKFNTVESLILDEGLRIEALDFHPVQDMMFVILNTKVALSQKLSAYPSLKKADIEHLRRYSFIGGGTGVHWPDLDEDLSLKGFLQNELRKVVESDNSFTVAN